MNIEALQQLRRVVQDAPDDLLHMRAVVEEAACGTARCALGWCIVDPWFQKNTAINDIYPIDYSRPGLVLDPGTQALFDISCQDANNLFGGNLGRSIDEHAVSKEEVLWNIDELLAGRHALPYAAAYNRAVPVYATGIVNDSYYEEDEEGEPEEA